MKSAIRTKIETILGREFSTCYVDGWRAKKQYRMKLVTRTPATAEQIAEIANLPHVIEVGFLAPVRGCVGGIIVRFDCKTRIIKL